VNYSNEYLNREDRLRRIGELLAKGVTLLCLREAAEVRAGANAVTNTTRSHPVRRDSEIPQIEDPAQNQILTYLSNVGDASPRDIQRSLCIPKATAFRKLTKLLQLGLLARSGSTSAMRYRLVRSWTNGINSNPQVSIPDQPEKSYENVYQETQSVDLQPRRHGGATQRGDEVEKLPIKSMSDQRGVPDSISPLQSNTSPSI
jgi:hypothetical protein